jgi:PKD repeat protein
VDGGPWQESGATLTGLCVLGEHTIHFKEAPGWVPPQKQGVGFANGLARSVSSTYTTESGTVSVGLEPQAAIGAGARWRLDGGAWLRGGSALTGVSTGSHTIEFKDAPGWTKPSDQTVTVENGQTATTLGAYVRQTGSLSVTLDPQEALGAGWRADGGDWQASGFTLTELAVGPHMIEFRDVPGWAKPAKRFVTVENGRTVNVNGTYVQLTGILDVKILPEAAINAGAQWSLDEGATWQSANSPLAMPVGAYTVSFREVSGWATPESRSITIENGQTYRIEGRYLPQYTADFAASTTSGKVPLIVTFEDKTQGTLPTPVKWLWDFGDGRKSTRQNPTYAYRRPGTYTVTLTVTTSDGTTRTRKYADLVSAHVAPKANFTATPTRPKVLLPVSFLDRSIGSITEWAWDFGDGHASGDRYPSHAYQTPGAYTVRLTVSGPTGSSTTAKVISVQW